MLCFLLGRKMYEGAGLGEADLEHAMTVMGLADPDEGGRGEGPEWVVGLLEHYPETVSVFAAACPEHFPEPEAVHKKRVTLHKPPLEEAAAGFPGGEEALRAAFREANALDYALYEAAARRFAERRAEVLAGNAGGLAVVRAQGKPTQAGARVIAALSALHEHLAAGQSTVDWDEEALPPA